MRAAGVGLIIIWSPFDFDRLPWRFLNHGTREQDIIVFAWSKSTAAPRCSELGKLAVRASYLEWEPGRGAKERFFNIAASSYVQRNIPIEALIGCDGGAKPPTRLHQTLVLEPR